tara:strand:- start:293 stop:457 length:165 start_codon:yes stop_codon:yes gene_type:complete
MFTRTIFIFITGTLFGAYLSQNYIIPDIKTFIDKGYKTAMILEKKMRKNEEDND